MVSRREEGSAFARFRTNIQGSGKVDKILESSNKHRVVFVQFFVPISCDFVDRALA